MTAKKRKNKSSSNYSFLNIDEDFNFIIDSYQTAMNPLLTPPGESRARRKIMRKIASRRAPNRIGVLDLIEKITKSYEKKEITFDVAINRLANISQRYGDKNLNNGIMAKVNMLNGHNQEKQLRPEKNIALFSNLSPPAKKRKKSKKRKTKKKGWDPSKDEHPMAKFLGGK